MQVLETCFPTSEAYIRRKPGVQGEASRPLSLFNRAKGMKLLPSISTQQTKVSNNEDLLNRQTWQGYPASHTRITCQGGTSPIHTNFLDHRHLETASQWWFLTLWVKSKAVTNYYYSLQCKVWLWGKDTYNKTTILVIVTVVEMAILNRGNPFAYSKNRPTLIPSVLSPKRGCNFNTSRHVFVLKVYFDR